MSKAHKPERLLTNIAEHHSDKTRVSTPLLIAAFKGAGANVEYDPQKGTLKITHGTLAATFSGVGARDMTFPAASQLCVIARVLKEKPATAVAAETSAAPTLVAEPV